MSASHRHGLAVLLACFMLPLSAFGADATGYKQAIGPRDWSFPRDHGRHDGFRIEWWYFTGNLVDASGKRFGYQLTFFRTLMAPEPVHRASAWATGDLYFAHVAVADIAGKQFFYHDTLSRGRAGLAAASEETMDVRLKNWSATLDGGIAHLQASTPDFSLDLSCNEQKPVFQGPGGLSQKGPAAGQASYYYSMPQMTTRGTLLIQSKRYALSGLTWFDHEFSSNVLSENQLGWDWISLQLIDGRSLMLYRLRNKDGTDTRFGSLADPDGKISYLHPEQIEMAGLDPVAAPSGARYPQRWRVRVAGVNEGRAFEVKTLLADCELRTSDSTNVTYYEGPMEGIGGDDAVLGRGYLEMTGYARGGSEGLFGEYECLDVEARCPRCLRQRALRHRAANCGEL